MLSAVNKVTVIHNEYNVAVHSGGNALSNNDLCAAFGFFRKLCAKIGFRKKIQGRKAVVKNINRRVFDYGTRNGKALLLSSGKILARLVKLVVVSVFKSVHKGGKLRNISGLMNFIIRGVGLAHKNIILYCTGIY